ncbi:Lysophospholipase 1 [Sphaceloma murrayae]|uniref:Lysophospholipase 1 n=1 Tax=Sphaceloma murrayae TaxID=2082308 RepID=A0A2K1QQT3_9PEZI|nr:Lysophospholipase 1 [Sphaceloma murrayae]
MAAASDFSQHHFFLPRCETCLSQHCYNSSIHRSFPPLPQRGSNSTMGLLSSIRRKVTRRSPSPPSKGIPQLPMTTEAAYHGPQLAPSNTASPPPYSASNPNPPAATTINAPLPATNLPPLSTQDDPYAFLSSFDTVFLIDDSSSMRGARWHAAAHAVATIAPICTAHDLDGIDIRFLNAPSQPYYSNVRSAATVNEIFSSVEPFGGTPTGQRLDGILREYLSRYEKSTKRRSRRGSPDSAAGGGPGGGSRSSSRQAAVKPLNVIVITDGVPTDDLESPLVSAAKKLDKLDAPAWQVGVQFFQVGEDASAADALRGLDDGLSEIARGEVRDMIDTVPFEGGMATGAGRGGAYGGVRGQLTAEGILKVVLGAVNRRLDRREQGTHG